MTLERFMAGLQKHIEEYRDQHWPEEPDDYETISFNSTMSPDGRISMAYHFRARPSEDPPPREG